MDKTNEIQAMTKDLTEYLKIEEKCKDKALFNGGVIDRFFGIIFAQSRHIIEIEKDVAELKEKLQKLEKK